MRPFVSSDPLRDVLSRGGRRILFSEVSDDHEKIKRLSYLAVQIIVSHGRLVSCTVPLLFKVVLKPPQEGLDVIPV